MNQTAILLGAKLSKGVLENGTAYDSTKIYVQTQMQQTPDAVGFAVSEFNWGTSDNFAKIKDLSFPVEVSLSIDFVTNGKTSKMIVTDVQPIKTTKIQQ